MFAQAFLILVSAPFSVVLGAPQDLWNPFPGTPPDVEAFIRDPILDDFSWTTSPTPSDYLLHASTRPPKTDKIPSITFSERSIENKIKSLISQIRTNQLAKLIATEAFRGHIRGYMELFTSNRQTVLEQTATKAILFRKTCDCGLRRDVSPCPEECLYTCYSYDLILNDCRTFSILDSCRCSSTDNGTRCGRDMENCFEHKIIETGSNCSEHIPDEGAIIESVNIWVNLIVEPVRKILWSIESKLDLHMDTSTSARQFYALNERSCAAKSDFCAENQTIEDNFDFRAMGKNVTLELVRAQELSELAARKIYDLQQQVIGKIVNSAQKYVCCRDTNKLTVDGYKCENP